VLNRWLGAHDSVISPVDLRVHHAVSLEMQNEQVRPLLSQTMDLRVTVEVFRAEDRHARDDTADDEKADRWHMFRAQTNATVVPG
jgi:hypothetical protein